MNDTGAKNVTGNKSASGSENRSPERNNETKGRGQESRGKSERAQSEPGATVRCNQKGAQIQAELDRPIKDAANTIKNITSEMKDVAFVVGLVDPPLGAMIWGGAKGIEVGLGIHEHFELERNKEFAARVTERCLSQAGQRLRLR